MVELCIKFELYTKFKRNRTIRGSVIAILVFDHLYYLEHVALCSGIIFTKFDLR